MAEAQNVWGDSWHRELNAFLSNVLNWNQLGERNVDVMDPETGRDRGLDSVFSYKRNQNSNQQIVLIEAKRIANIHNTSKGKIENWISTLSEKLNQLPHSKEFSNQFRQESGADFGLGLVALWIEDTADEAEMKLHTWLSQIRTPERRIVQHIGFISNDVITRLIAVHEEIERIGGSLECEIINYYVPDYGDLPASDNESLPFESLFSKLIFCKAKMRQELIGRPEEVNFYDQVYVFYLDPIISFDDLNFIGIVLRSFQLLHSNPIVIYTLHQRTEIRHYIAQFSKEFDRNSNGNQIQFETLSPKLY